MRKLIAIVGLLLLAACSSNNGKSILVFPDVGVPDVIVDAASDDVVEVEPADAGRSLDQGYPELDPMIYYGGSVYTAPPNVYFIWYGNWTDVNTRPILEDFMINISDSPWLQIVTGYYQQAGGGVPFSDAGLIPLGRFNAIKNRNLQSDGGLLDTGPRDVSDANVEAGLGPQLFVTSKVNFIKSVFVGYTLGTSLKDADIVAIVGDVIVANQVPSDPNGIYFVFTSSDVSESSGYYAFCSDYCGWHGNYTIFNDNLRIVFVGDTGACEGCNLQQQYKQLGYPNPPNNDWSADSMASVVAHELAETMTDPDPNTNPSWLDSYGEEVGDKCAWVFGTTFVTPNNGLANIVLGHRNFLIQEDFVNVDGGYCGMSP
jgi:hypothetical protein